MSIHAFLHNNIVSFSFLSFFFSGDPVSANRSCSIRFGSIDRGQHIRFHLYRRRCILLCKDFPTPYMVDSGSTGSDESLRLAYVMMHFI